MAATARLRMVSHCPTALSRGEGLQDVGRPPDTGTEIVHHPLPDGEGVLCLATGKSPRGEHCHSVVGRMVGFNFELLHDPHPSGEGIEGLPICIEFLVPVDPAAMTLRESLEAGFVE
jgi:hypothetical protein